MSPFPPEHIDLSQLLASDHLLPAERHTVVLGGKAYMWSRTSPYGPLTLSPGYAPGDPMGCDYVEPVQQFQDHWPRVCTIHRFHAGQHRHKPTLDSPVELWGPERPAQPRGVVVRAPGLPAAGASAEQFILEDL